MPSPVFGTASTAAAVAAGAEVVSVDVAAGAGAVSVEAAGAGVVSAVADLAFILNVASAEPSAKRIRTV